MLVVEDNTTFLDAYEQGLRASLTAEMASLFSESIAPSRLDKNRNTYEKLEILYL